MTTTHAFNDPDDLANGGAWFDAHGRRICHWSWDGASKSLLVELRLRCKRVDLSGCDEQALSAARLRDRLPHLALEVADSMKEARAQAAYI